MKKWLVLLALVAALALIPTVVSAADLMEGDFTGDGHVNIVDAMAIARYVVDPEGTAGIMYFVPTPDNLTCGDVNDDGATNIVDAMLIARWVVDPDGSAGVLATPLWQSPADDGLLPPAP